jgi:membrane associated rhomboid family serine protease
MFIPMNKICLYGIFCVPGFIYGILYLLYCSMAERKGLQEGINHSAHFWGAMFGVGFSILVYPSVVPAFIQQIMDWKIFW